MRTVFLVILILGTFSTQALGRQWSARAGGFTVEAELVDVKDGKAILKKTDGTQISVPLNKLSLGDLRYINETLATAEGQATGKVEKPAEPRLSEKPASSPPAESPVKAIEKEPKDNAKERPSDAAWGSESELTVDERTSVTFGPPGCPAVLAGRQIWDGVKSTVRAELQGECVAGGMAAFSPDGAWVAVADKTPNIENTSVAVYEAKTGKLRFTAPGDAKRFVDVLVLSNDRLFLGNRLDADLLVWNLQTGQQEKSVKLPDRTPPGKTAFTPDGKYMAMAVHDRMLVVQTDTGRIAATMAPPKAADGLGTPLPARPAPKRTVGRVRPNSAPRVDSTDAIFVYAWLQALSFSPDSKELAGISTHPKPRLMCWNSSGKLVFDEPFFDDGRPFWENSLQWFPDRNAWLIAGDVFDRESKHIVLSVKMPFGTRFTLHVLDQDRLLGRMPDSLSQIKVYQVPWRQIGESLKLMNEKGAALLSPAEPVGINIALGELRGSREETASALRQALAIRLARDGLRLGDEGRAFFRLKFSEKAGDSLPIYERQSPFDRRGADTGRRATEAKGSLVIELIVPGQAEPIWRDTVSAISATSFSGEITDDTVRTSMIGNMARTLQQVSIPYFIPKDERMLALPLVIGGK
jgi:hypothetical protein